MDRRDEYHQSFVTSYPQRIRQYANTLLQPILQTPNVAPTSRTTKRGTTVINYADDAYDDDDFDDSDNPRRPTGLRSLRREDLEKRDQQEKKFGEEIYRPVDLQPIYRHWMIDTAKRRTMTVQGAHAQAQFPLTLIPIRIDLDVPAHQQQEPYPTHPQSAERGINMSLPPFKRPEQLPGYKIRDVFLWNLHEALYTPEDFAQIFVQDLDLPNQQAAVFQISHQIRTQLEEYAGLALHPLFHPAPKRAAGTVPRVNGTTAAQSRDGTPRLGTSRVSSTTPALGTPAPSTPQPQSQLQPQPFTLSNGATVTARASPLPAELLVAPNDRSSEELTHLNPDDTYRCLITLSIYLSSKLYQDKFEWSLLHPPGAAEAFAKQTCADMGLNGEWVLAITHAIYEAVLRLKKETCEGGMIGIVGPSGAFGSGEIDNQAVRGEEGAGWRYDDADFGAEWEPKLEALSKEEIEKREGDRERQLRRLRRETARFSSTSGMALTAREVEAQNRGSYFDLPGAGGVDGDTPLMGRGERSKKKRRLNAGGGGGGGNGSNNRSPSPGGTPMVEENKDSGWGGERSKLQEYERTNWRCRWCQVHGSAVWAVRDGPMGPRTLCNNCGLLYERDKKLPVWNKDLHAGKRVYAGGSR